MGSCQGRRRREPILNGADRLTGGLARSRLYTAADGRQIAVGALEEKFWQAFCDVIGLAPKLRDDLADLGASIAEVARLLAARPASHWAPPLAAADCCCTVVKSPLEAAADPRFAGRGIFDWKVRMGDRRVPALPLPIALAFRARPSQDATAPDLGRHNQEFGLDRL